MAASQRLRGSAPELAALILAPVVPERRAGAKHDLSLPSPHDRKLIEPVCLRRVPYPPFCPTSPTPPPLRFCALGIASPALTGLCARISLELISTSSHLCDAGRKDNSCNSSAWSRKMRQVKWGSESSPRPPLPTTTTPLPSSPKIIQMVFHLQKIGCG